MGGPLLKNYVDGKFTAPSTRRNLDVDNPATGEVICQVPMSTAADLDVAVQAASRAFLTWSATPVSRRVSYLFSLISAMRRDEEELCKVLVEEMGKSLADAKAEMKRSVQNIEAACAMPMIQQGELLVGAAPDIDGEVLRLPLGVFGVIAPFNFPAMVPFWFIPYAVATGNCVVVKASEQVPNTLDRIFALIHKTGLPPGVCNLVHGDKEAAEALIDHPQVAGISFVGSSKIAKTVARRCVEQGKRFQALGSAKNHLVVMPDANMDECVRNMVTSCYGCAGQRCMASSVIVAVGDQTYQEVIQRFTTASQTVPVADPLDPAVADDPMVMGPVISAKNKSFIESMIEIGVQEGATLLLDGRGIEVDGCPGGHFVGPTILADVQPSTQVHTTEIFGPVVAIMKADSFDEAVRILNDHPYGNGASIYTASGYWARRFKLEVKAGMIGVNVGIPAPVAYLPFGGQKASIFSDIKAQGRDVLNFYTDARIVTQRFWPER